MNAPKTPMQPKQKLGLSFQLFGITMLIVNVYSSTKIGSSNPVILALGLGLVFGGMFMVIGRKKNS